MPTAESTPLLGQSSNYYFLNTDKDQPLTNSSDGGLEVEGRPEGSSEAEFQPKMINSRAKEVPQSEEQAQSQSKQSSDLGFFSSWFGSKKNDDPATADATTTPTPPTSTLLLKQRKAPIKIEPKVFFANERTFLAWMHISIILAGASIAILAFAEPDDNPRSQIYGLVMLPVAIAFIVYSMYQFLRRAQMIRNKHPGPYDDTVGPTVLAVMLMVSIVCQFAIKLSSMDLY